jgi:cytochrome bd-type quinol oxidase subunit 2
LSSTDSVNRSVRWTRIVAVLAGVSFIGFGLWAMAGPESFFDALAHFEPYNRHFLQDIGAFLIGLGAVLVLAAIPSRADALAVGLTGVGVGSVAHTVSHALGYDLGGQPALDIPALAVLSLVLLVAGLLRWREVAARSE